MTVLDSYRLDYMCKTRTDWTICAKLRQCWPTVLDSDRLDCLCETRTEMTDCPGETSSWLSTRTDLTDCQRHWQNWLRDCPRLRPSLTDCPRLGHETLSATPHLGPAAGWKYRSCTWKYRALLSAAKIPPLLWKTLNSIAQYALARRLLEGIMDRHLIEVVVIEKIAWLLSRPPCGDWCQCWIWQLGASLGHVLGAKHFRADGEDLCALFPGF